MALDDLQQPNIGKPDFAKGNTGAKKLWAILTTVGFAVFWVYALWMASSLFGDQEMHWSAPILCVLGLALGIYGRRRVEKG